MGYRMTDHERLAAHKEIATKFLHIVARHIRNADTLEAATALMRAGARQLEALPRQMAPLLGADNDVMPPQLAEFLRRRRRK